MGLNSGQRPNHSEGEYWLETSVQIGDGNCFLGGSSNRGIELRHSYDPVDKLTLAAASGDLSQVQSTLDWGAPVDGRDRRVRPP